MTAEQLDLAHYMESYFQIALEYLIKVKALERGRENYFTHIRKTFLENTKDKTEMLGHSDIVSTMSVDPSGKFLASGSWDRTLRIWSLEDFQEVASEKLVPGIASLAWSKNGDIVFSADFSGSIVSWSL